MIVLFSHKYMYPLYICVILSLDNLFLKIYLRSREKERERKKATELLKQMGKGWWKKYFFLVPSEKKYSEQNERITHPAWILFTDLSFLMFTYSVFRKNKHLFLNFIGIMREWMKVFYPGWLTEFLWHLSLDLSVNEKYKVSF